MTATDVKTAQLHRRLTETLDTETADALIERLPPDWEKLATKTDLKEFATKEDLKEFATKEDLKGFATKTDLLAMEGRIERRAARNLRIILFTFAGFALMVMGMFTTILVSGVLPTG